MTREVTERDFRADQFKDAKVEDYEFRADGALVRKDRWEVGMLAVARAAGFSTRDGFEIDDVVKAVSDVMGGWSRVDDDDYQPNNDAPCPIDLRFPEGSILLRCQHKQGSTYAWEAENGYPVEVELENAEYWRPSA